MAAIGKIRARASKEPLTYAFCLDTVRVSPISSYRVVGKSYGA